MLSVRVVCAVVALGVAGLPLVPPLHLHGIKEAGHHDRLVHSHAEAHSQAHHHHSSLSEHSSQREHTAQAEHLATAFDDQDTVLITFDPVFALPHASHVLAPPASAVQLLAEPPAEEPLVATIYVERLIHSPPRAPALLRGPPSSSLL